MSSYRVTTVNPFALLGDSDDPSSTSVAQKSNLIKEDVPSISKENHPQSSQKKGVAGQQAKKEQQPQQQQKEQQQANKISNNKNIRPRKQQQQQQQQPLVPVNQNTSIETDFKNRAGPPQRRNFNRSELPVRDGKRQYERRSGTGRGREVAKSGGGKRNWGSQVPTSAEANELENNAVAETKEEEEETKVEESPKEPVEGETTEPEAESEAATSSKQEKSYEEYLSEQRKKKLQCVSAPKPRAAGEGVKNSEWDKYVPLNTPTNEKPTEQKRKQKTEDKPEDKPETKKEKKVGINELFHIKPREQDREGGGGRGRGRRGQRRFQQQPPRAQEQPQPQAPVFTDEGTFPSLK